MSITLDNFQAFVPSRIYWRGEEYHAGGAVTSLRKTSGGEWHAKVAGTNDYNVHVTIHGNGGLSWSCDCPYDGTMCKHVVATLLAMRERGLDTQHGSDHFEDDDFDDADDSDEYDGFVSEDPIYKVILDDDDDDDDDSNADDELERLIAVANKDDLAEFLRSRAGCDPALRNALVRHIKLRYVNPSKANNTDYARLVHQTLQACVDTHRTRYNDYYDETNWDEVANQACALVEKGEKLLLAGNAWAAVTIAMEVLDTIDDMMDESLVYDDDADIGCACESAGDLLLKAIDAPSINEGQRRETISRVKELTASEIENYGFYNFSDLVTRLSEKVLNGDDTISLLNDLIANAPSYQREGYVLQKINLLGKMGRTQEREATIDEFISVPRVRELRMRELIAAGRYADALRVIAAGISQAQSSGAYGREREWLKHKMKVLGLMGDTAAQVDVARQLFLSSGYQAMEYYHVLKQLIPAKQWKAQLAAMLASEHNLSNDSLAKIYIEEKDLDKLMAMVSNQQYNRLDTIMDYAVHLRKTHSAELIPLLDHDIRDYADCNMGRNHYEHLADALRVMRNLKGGRAIAKDLAAHLCAAYPRRRAMVEILTPLKK